jgi:hypothetical protein
MTGKARVDPSQFAHGRFTFLHALGGGGYGEVFAAYDRDLGADVALKRLKRVDATTLAAFRREFRVLSALNHPNLVRLGDLFEENGHWFFSMELVRGHSFLDWVRDPGSPAGYDEDRLLRGLAQLVRGLMAVHTAGFLHRDVKPENVLVTYEGRVVLLDFGLSSSREQRPDEEDGLVFGTPAYMAPEQACAAALEPSADFYSLGVLLYEALTGNVPFVGASIDTLLRKQHELPSPPRALSPWISERLDALCMQLLHIKPSLRPSGAEILRALGEGLPAQRPSAPAPAFIGRRAELALMEESLARALQGQATALLVEGEAGIGKTALVERFLQTAAADERPWLLVRGRCYERESVSYKAFEGVIDAITSWLRSLPFAQSVASLPPDAPLLARQFPALERVPALAACQPNEPPVEPAELRLRLIAVFTELLCDLARKQLLVIWLEDLHWADLDSLRLLAELRARISGSQVLWIGTARIAPDVSAARQHLLRDMFRDVDARLIQLGGLDESEALSYARGLPRAACSEVELARTVQSAAGHPALIAELLLTSNSEVHTGTHAEALRRVLEPRLAALSPGTGELLELVALSGVPCSPSVLVHAFGDGESFTGRLHELRAARLVRSTDGLIECAHEYVSAAVCERLDPSLRRERHERLARALERHARVDAAQLAEAWLRARDLQRALPHLCDAAREAGAALAFERAARLYGQALQFGAEILSATELTEIRVERAHALAQAGLNAEAAEEYLTASAETTRSDALALRRKAAHYLLRAGLVQQGIALTNTLLAEVDVTLPDTVPSALRGVLWQRFCLRAARYARLGRPATARADDAQLARLDLLWSVAPALNTVDYLRGAQLQAQYARAAEASGDRTHRIQSLLMEAVYRAAIPSAGYERLLSECEILLSEDATAYQRALLAQCRGTVAFLETRYADAREFLVIAEESLRTRCLDVAWELGYTRGNLLCSLALLGEYTALDESSRAWLKEASDRGNAFARLYVSTVGMGAIRHLLDDTPREGDDELDACFGGFAEISSTWSLDGFQAPHVGELFSRTLLRLYDGGDTADRYLAAHAPRAERSLVMRSPGVHANLGQLRVRALLASAKAKRASARRECLRLAKQRLSALSKTRLSIAHAYVSDLTGQLSALEGRHEFAVRELEAAIAAYERMGIRSWSEPARFLLGQLRGGEEGRALREAARAWATSQRFVAPDRYLTSFAPAADG